MAGGSLIIQWRHVRVYALGHVSDALVIVAPRVRSVHSSGLFRAARHGAHRGRRLARQLGYND